MTRAGKLLVVIWLAGLFLAGSLSAQVGTNGATRLGARAGATPPLPLMSFPTPGKSPVAVFRELLAMTFVERLHVLSNRPPAVRRQILAKLREYETLRPNERELRLKVTELRWYLYPLMRAPASNRVELLTRVPEDDRKLVEDRLREWDRLPVAAQKELLQNEAVIRCLTDVPPGSNAPAPPRLLERKVQEWQALPEAERQRLLVQFDRYFQLTPAEKQKVLHTLSEAERRQIEKTLARFRTLTPSQRSRCIRGFEKLSELSPAEREQFLKNAERWTLMTPEEQQKWRTLVSIAPTLPTAADELAKVPRPVVPPVHRHAPPQTTNGG